MDERDRTDSVVLLVVWVLPLLLVAALLALAGLPRVAAALVAVEVVVGLLIALARRRPPAGPGGAPAARPWLVPVVMVLVVVALFGLGAVVALTG